MNEKILSKSEMLDSFKLYLKNRGYSKNTVKEYLLYTKDCLNMHWRTTDQIDDMIWNMTKSSERAKFKKALRRFNEFRERENMYNQI